MLMKQQMVTNSAIIHGLHVCHDIKILPVTELMNIPGATFVKSTQSSATTEQTWHH